jgi:hypothetical protein
MSGALDFDINAFMSSLGTPDVGATTSYDYSFDPEDYRTDPVDYDFTDTFDADAFMDIFDVGNVGDSYSGSGLNLDFLTDPYRDPTKFDDQGFNVDFLDDIFGTSGGFDDAIFSDTSSLPALLAAATAQEDSKEGKPNAFQQFLGGLLGGGSSGKGDLNLGQLGLALGLSSFLKDRGAFKPDIAPVGYQGSIPEYTAIREQVTGRDDTDRRPGSGGRRYFSDTIYAKKPEGQQPMSVEEARAKAAAQAAGFMEGGSVLRDGGYLQGDTDGQADLIPADIDGVQEARLSHGEFVLPADVVAMLGNGNSDAGAEALDEFMSMVRTKATGTPKQQKNIDADQVLMMLSKRMG